jgi:hypothetical protein
VVLIQHMLEQVSLKSHEPLRGHGWCSIDDARSSYRWTFHPRREHDHHFIHSARQSISDLLLDSITWAQRRHHVCEMRRKRIEMGVKWAPIMRVFIGGWGQNLIIFFCNIFLVQTVKKWLVYTTIKHHCSGGSDCSNGHLMTHFYSVSSAMSPNRPSLLWPSLATGSGDITSSSVATVAIW